MCFLTGIRFFRDPESDSSGGSDSSDDGSSSVWDTIAANGGSYLTGFAQIINATKGTPTVTNGVVYKAPVTTATAFSSKYMVYIILGIVALIALFFILSKH